MSNSNEKKSIKLLHKPPKGKLKALVLVFLWIALWNIIYQALHGVMPHEGLRIVNWPFFISVAVFFLQEELTYDFYMWANRRENYFKNWAPFNNNPGRKMPTIMQWYGVKFEKSCDCFECIGF